MNTKNIHTQSGFTLIELMVSLSLFVILVLALVSSLYNVNDASRRVQAMRSTIDNLSFAIESMSRTIRTGDNISCGDPVTGGGIDCLYTTDGSTRISVLSRVGAPRRIQYKLETANNHGSIMRCVTDINTLACPSENWTAVTSPEIDIQKLQFYVSGSGKYPENEEQPSVTLFVSGVATAGENNTTPFAIQTYLSQRVVE